MNKYEARCHLCEHKIYAPAEDEEEACRHFVDAGWIFNYKPKDEITIYIWWTCSGCQENTANEEAS